MTKIILPDSGKSAIIGGTPRNELEAFYDDLVASLLQITARYPNVKERQVIMMIGAMIGYFASNYSTRDRLIDRDLRIGIAKAMEDYGKNPALRERMQKAMKGRI